MTSHENGPEDLLRDAFRDRVDNADFAATPMSDVMSTARVIRRRRRTTTLLATAAAVVAVTVPTAILVDHDPGSTPAPGTNPPSPTSTPSASAPTSALADLPTGPPPAINYVADHVFLGPGGSRFGLPDDRGVSAITPYHGGFLVADTRNFEGSIGLAFVGGTGKRVEEWCSSGAPAVSADGHLTAWVSFPCLESGQTGETLVHRGITTGMGEGETTQSVGERAPITVSGFLGEDVVVDGAWEEQAYLTDLVSEPRPIADLSTVQSVDEVGGLVAGQWGEDNADALVLDPRTGEHRWTAAGLWLGEFSPDGGLIPGQDRDGWSMFDRIGSAVYDLDVPAGSQLSSMGWEDDRHLLVVVTTEREIAVVRFGPDGAAELAAPVVLYDPNDPAYVLAVHP